MADNKINVIALVENLELTVPHRLPSPDFQQANSFLRLKNPAPTPEVTESSMKRIELAEDDPKNLHPRHLNLDVNKPDAGDEKKDNDTPGLKLDGLEIRQRYLPGTVLIKHVAETISKSSDVNEAQMASATVERIRKLTQRSRKRTLEVRRNPLRSAARKDFKDSARVTTSRQRLLAGRRRAAAIAAATSASETVSNNAPINKTPLEQSTRGELPLSIGKRSRTGNYMNTRSVTRKMHNVGATYEAPSWRDFIEWKEWPVHGMHERPVYHPQFGLAAEYNGRLYASFDGEGYRELGSADATQIELPRFDSRMDSLDSSIPSGDSIGVHSTKFLPHTISQFATATAAALARQKLGYGSFQNSLYTRTTADRINRMSGLFDLGPRLSNYDSLHSSYGLVQQQHQHQQQQQQQHRQQQVDQIRKIDERLQQSLQRLQQQTKFTPGRLISKEVIKNLQNVTLAQKTPQQSPSKCLIMPRTPATTSTVTLPVTMPFCGVQTFNSFKSNTKNKLVFVRAPEAPKKSLSIEKTATITSSTQNFSLSWGDMRNFRRKPDPTVRGYRELPFLENNNRRTPRTLTTWSKKIDSIPTPSIIDSSSSSSFNSICAPTSSISSSNSNSSTITCSNTANILDSNRLSRIGRYFTPVRLTEPASIFRPNSNLSSTPKLRDDPGLLSTTCTGVEIGFRPTLEQKDDHLSEVLDLSKKEPPKVEVEDSKVKDDKNVPQNHATDLVQYFQNFGADESSDTFEESKNLT